MHMVFVYFNHIFYYGGLLYSYGCIHTIFMHEILQNISNNQCMVSAALAICTLIQVPGYSSLPHLL